MAAHTLPGTRRASRSKTSDYRTAELCSSVCFAPLASQLGTSGRLRAANIPASRTKPCGHYLVSLKNDHGQADCDSYVCVNLYYELLIAMKDG